MRVRLALLGLVLAIGCGPIEYLNQVARKASTAVAAAKTAGAEKLAPYEYTAAVEYLHKAREEAGHAQYQVASTLGEKAEFMAEKARTLSEQRAKESKTP